MGSVVGGLIGQSQAAGDRGTSRDAANIGNQILQELQNAPDISKPLILEKYKQAGVLTPEMEQYINAGQSKAAGIGTDQQSMDAQRSALQQLQQRSVGGLTAADRAALAQTQQGVQADTRSKQAQILQQAAMRGQGGGTSELAAELMASQGGANQQSANANSLAQQAGAQALQATGMTGQLGGQINQQLFGEDLQKANAADQMQRFNVQNQLAQQQRNVGATNQAQAGNLANAQNISNQNVGNQNAELNNQTQRAMQQYGANVNTASVKSGGQNQLAGALNTMGQQTADSWGKMGAGVDQAAAAIFAPTAAAYDGGMIDGRAKGGQVPGQAKVDGDSPVNDVVHALLSPGEIVVPRTISQSKFGKHLVKIIDAHNNLKRHMNGEE